MKRRIAILGGGLGALSTAYALISRPFWKRHYDITVYQLGWRLGGKCASSRQSTFGNRNLEHGLHVWLGCYHNAFRMLRDCYAKANWKEYSKLATVDDAMSAQDEVPCMDNIDGKWYVWPIKCPRHPGKPGAGFLGLFSMWHGARKSLEVLAHHNRQYRENLGVRDLDDPLNAAHLFAISMPKKPIKHTDYHRQNLMRLLDSSQELHHELASSHPTNDPVMHRLWVFLDLGIAMLRGLVADSVFINGHESIDSWEFRVWLRHHGAHENTLYSGLVRELYDAGFSYCEGITGTGVGADQGKAELAAGTAVYSALQVSINYAGSVCYELNAGMGEVVIAPVYAALKEAGVKFEFFSDVKKLVLDSQSRGVEKILIGKQVELLDGFYDPLDLNADNGIPTWPDHPFLDQIENGEMLDGVNLESSWSGWRDKVDVALERGKDFDQVVLAISIAALPTICSDLAAAPGALGEKWRKMFDAVRTTQTQAAQLWFNCSLDQSGWDAGPVPVDAGPEPYDVWADIDSVLATESWPEDGPKSLHYLCGPLRGDYDEMPPGDVSVPAIADGRVFDEVSDWLEKNAHAIWPALRTPRGNFDWSVLYDPQNRVGRERLRAQFLRANIDPSERYVLSVPGSSKHRMDADDTLLDNVVVAGDWTRTPFNAGNVEATVFSGLAASAAIADRLESFPVRLLGNVEAYLWQRGLWCRS